MSLRDWTLQYNMLWAAFTAETDDCICPEGFTAFAGECRKISTLPTQQPPTFTALPLIAKNYDQYSWYGVKFYDPGYELGGAGTYEWWVDDGINFWRNVNNYPSAGSRVLGAMNRCGIWTTTFASLQSIGFSTCINVPAEKTYLVGFGVDNYVTIRVDGVPLMQMAPITDANTFRYWHVYPLVIKKGIHVLEIIASNQSSIAAIGAEIYNATKEELKLVTNQEELDPYLLFSTKDLVGTTTNLGTNGYPIMDDYALVLCDGNPPYYRKIEYKPCS